jgi:ArsR family transcriptional regulator, lead/cadmium/zinc/bismuth-responsive transcriptional repressor
MTDAYTLQAEFFKAFSHPVRIRILEILSQKEACVCQLTPVLLQRQPYVSQQLMALREAGLVTSRREGTIIYYSLTNPLVSHLLDEARHILACPERTTVELPEVNQLMLPQTNVCPCVSWVPEED